MALSRRRPRRVVPPAGPVRSRPGVAPPANAGALHGLESVGYLLAEASRRAEALPPADVAWALDTLRSVYRAVRALRPPAG